MSLALAAIRNMVVWALLLGTGAYVGFTYDESRYHYRQPPQPTPAYSIGELSGDIYNPVLQTKAALVIEKRRQAYVKQHKRSRKPCANTSAATSR